MSSTVGGISSSSAVAPIGFDSKPEKPCSITTIHYIRDLPTEHPEGTVVLFDVDDTLIDFPFMLGSRAWRKYIKEATKHDKERNWHDILSLHLSKNYPTASVESHTQIVVSEMQVSCKQQVFGYTARERSKWYTTPAEGIDEMTVSQIASTGVILEKAAAHQPLDYLTQIPQYYKGVFFIEQDLKGDFFYLQMAGQKHVPKKVVVADDNLQQLESMVKAVQLLRDQGIFIELEAYHYVATVPKGAKFNPLIANIQLFYFLNSDGKEKLSDEEAASITRTADVGDDPTGYYLRESLALMVTKKILI